MTLRLQTESVPDWQHNRDGEQLTCSQRSLAGEALEPLQPLGCRKTDGNPSQGPAASHMYPRLQNAAAERKGLKLD